MSAGIFLVYKRICLMVCGGQTDGYEQHKISNVNVKLLYHHPTRSLDLSQGGEPGLPATGERGWITTR